MALWSRIGNAFRGDGLSREIDEELQAHIAEGIEEGQDPAEARRAFGPVLRRREESRDIRLLPWLDSLRADAVFGWRQLMKKKTTSAAAVLSLGLAIGACTSAFRLIDALLLRPLPVAHAERLYSVAFENIGADGKLATYDSCSYPMFLQMRAAVQPQAESVAVSYAERVELTYGREQEMERAYRQFVSGRMFPAFGLRPALDALSMVLAGAVAGLMLGMASVRYIEALLFGVKPTDFAMLALPSLAILAAALLAAAPAVVHAVRIDPVSMLRAD